MPSGQSRVELYAAMRRDSHAGLSSPALQHKYGVTGWGKTFTDPRLCTAIVDRLTFGGNVIETGTESYRLTHTPS